jgi:hypothetical protein
MFVQKYQGKASYGKALVDNVFKAKVCKGNIYKGNARYGKACKVEIHTTCANHVSPPSP